MSYKFALNTLARHWPLSGQTPNNAGGFGYDISPWERLDRFLILGSEGGTYYVGERPLTVMNAQAVQSCLDEDGARVIRRIVEISTQGRAPKVQPVLFALAMAAAAHNEATRREALAVLPQVARTGTHVLLFADYINRLRGWGRGLRRGMAHWFSGMALDRLTLQAVKYRQRDGWSLRDVLRLAHPVTDERDRQALFRWLTHPDDPEAIAAARGALPMIQGLYRVREAQDAEEVADLIVRYSLPREAIPTEWLNHVAVWDALLVDMPMTAMIRNLGKMTAVGLLSETSDAGRYVARRLGDVEQLAAARIHPIQVLLALKTYRGGNGLRGGLSWDPVPDLVDALDQAYEQSFRFVTPTGKKLLIALDVSASMEWWTCGGSPLTALEAAAAVAQVFVRTEPSVKVIGVDTSVHKAIEKARAEPLDRFVSACAAIGGGGTDLSLPFTWAAKRKERFDAILTLTDNETWAGRQHPVQALVRYRNKVNAEARAVLLATTSTRTSVIPKTDPLSFGVAGFDAAVPLLVGDFLRG